MFFLNLTLGTPHPVVLVGAQRPASALGSDAGPNLVNALQVAARRPPALKAIITICSTDDRYRDDVHYMGGTKLNSGFGWASFLFATQCRPPDPVLVDIVKDGRKIPALVQTGKSGYMFILDRETGAPVFGVEEQPVTQGNAPGEFYAATQAFPLKPPPLARVSIKRADIVTAPEFAQ